MVVLILRTSSNIFRSVIGLKKKKPLYTGGKTLGGLIIQIKKNNLFSRISLERYSTDKIEHSG